MPRSLINKARSLVVTRLLAKAVDLAIVVVVGALLPTFLGPLLGFAYSLCADGLPIKGFEGRSAGKRVMGLRVVRVGRDEHASLLDSIIRNAPIGVATFFAIIPVWGWLFFVLVGVPLVAIEVYLMFRVENGQRLGDVMADTEVVDAPEGGMGSRGGTGARARGSAAAGGGGAVTNRTMTMGELKAEWERKHPNSAILDVRSVGEFEDGHVPGALNIPLDRIPERVDELRKLDTVYVHCQGGRRAQMAADFLRGAGLKNIVCVDEGGMPDWEGAGFPVER